MTMKECNSQGGVSNVVNRTHASTYFFGDEIFRYNNAKTYPATNRVEALIRWLVDQIIQSICAQTKWDKRGGRIRLIALRQKFRFPVQAIRWPAKMSSKVKRGPAFSSVSLFMYWLEILVIEAFEIDYLGV